MLSLTHIHAFWNFFRTFNIELIFGNSVRVSILSWRIYVINIKWLFQRFRKLWQAATKICFYIKLNWQSCHRHIVVLRENITNVYLIFRLFPKYKWFFLKKKEHFLRYFILFSLILFLAPKYRTKYYPRFHVNRNSTS